MGTLLHFKDIYVHAFDDCKPAYVVLFLKGYAFCCALLWLVAMYALFYRIFTGFEF